MKIVEVGGPIEFLRFLADGRLFVISTSEDRQSRVTILSHLSQERVEITLPPTETRMFPTWRFEGGNLRDMNQVALSKDGEVAYLAWEGDLLGFRTADGAPVPHQIPGPLWQVILSPDNQKFVTASGNTTTAIADGEPRPRWQTDSEWPPHLCGFLSDGERYVCSDMNTVQIRTFDSDAIVEEVRYPASSLAHPLLSPDRRLLGLIGYTSMYVFNLEKLGKPKRISAKSSFGDFRSFAFHPYQPKMAVIHGGPTLVKVYELETMKQEYKLKWRLGPLSCVDFSPDGGQGAAGSEDGRIVVWDFEAQ